MAFMIRFGAATSKKSLPTARRSVIPSQTNNVQSLRRVGVREPEDSRDSLTWRRGTDNARIPRSTAVHCGMESKIGIELEVNRPRGYPSSQQPVSREDTLHSDCRPHLSKIADPVKKALKG